MEIKVREEIFDLTPEHCLVWPKHHLLAVADIHLGKADAFRQSGIWMPSAANNADLSRLSELVARYQIEEIVFLGDFVHTVLAVSAELVQIFADWRQKFPGRVTVLLGNHDRGLEKRWPSAWMDTERGYALRRDGFTFQHEAPAEPEENFVWAGHVHPVVNLTGGVDSLRLPCYLVTDFFGLLPAFSSLAGGYAVKPGRGQRVFAAVGEKVMEVGPSISL